MGTGMHQYPKHIKRMIREYAAQAFVFELGRALGELEQQFALWRAGQSARASSATASMHFTRARAAS